MLPSLFLRIFVASQQLGQNPENGEHAVRDRDRVRVRVRVTPSLTVVDGVNVIE